MSPALSEPRIVYRPLAKVLGVVGLHQPWSCILGCGESVYSWGETGEGVWRQHGENPEHRRFLGLGESGYAWLLEVHRYADVQS